MRSESQKKADKSYIGRCVRINSQISNTSELYTIINKLMTEYNIKSTSELAKRCIEIVYDNKIDLNV